MQFVKPCPSLFYFVIELKKIHSQYETRKKKIYMARLVKSLPPSLSLFLPPSLSKKCYLAHWNVFFPNGNHDEWDFMRTEEGRTLSFCTGLLLSPTSVEQKGTVRVLNDLTTRKIFLRYGGGGNISLFKGIFPNFTEVWWMKFLNFYRLVTFILFFFHFHSLPVVKLCLLIECAHSNNFFSWVHMSRLVVLSFPSLTNIFDIEIFNLTDSVIMRCTFIFRSKISYCAKSG